MTRPYTRAGSALMGGGTDGRAGAARRYRTADNPPGKAAGNQPCPPFKAFPPRPTQGAPSSEGPGPCRIRGCTALLAAGVEPDTGLLHLMALGGHSRPLV